MPHHAEPLPGRTRPRLHSPLALAGILAVAGALAGCGGGDAPEPPGDTDAASPPPAQQTAAAPQDAFWSNLESFCGQAFRGRVEETSGTDTDFSGELVMHVRECEPDEIRIPFHVGEDRSRTWIISRTDDGLRLKHDHRHEDGTEDEQTQYGGDTAEPGTATRQDFHADEFTTDMIPEAATNVWTVEAAPGNHFVYQLERVGTDRLVRLVFDVNYPVDPPPAPWGY